MAGNLINTNSQSVPDGLPFRSLRNQSSLTTVRVWRCNRSLRNNDGQEAGFLWARSSQSVSFLCIPSWLQWDEWGVSEGWVKGQANPSLVLSPSLQRHPQRFEWGVRGKPYCLCRRTPSLPALKWNTPNEISNTPKEILITPIVLTTFPANRRSAPCCRLDTSLLSSAQQGAECRSASKVMKHTMCTYVFFSIVSFLKVKKMESEKIITFSDPND